MSFGFGTKEFEVTTARLGCYRPEEHIDNPKDYADNEDARQYDRRLRGLIDEERELAIDPELGLKAYIASENLGIDTSAALVRKLFTQSIQLGRRYARNGNKEDLYEALRLLGTGCHCLEDFSAHSNYTELALIELGERDVFPHVGRDCKVRLRGARAPVYPIVTGTFGGVDFLHSVTGEFDDKATQSEIQELEGTLQQAQQQGGNPSIIQELLQKLPNGIFGGKDEAGKADELQTNATQQAMANNRISPREPEEWLAYITDVQKQIYPILEWHDEIMQSITETIEKIPILPDILENVQDQVNIFVFSLLAPFVLPIISQIKTELNTRSSEIIQSSVDKQHIVFRDDRCSDPTHSMLSKDHFSNVLNEPAGKVAGQVLRWVVPQLITAWDDERIDIGRTLNRIIRGVFHHPALRQIGEDGSADGRGLMFAVVEQWWNSKDEDEREGLRDQLSRSGVEEGRNHKPGVEDHGHGSAHKLGMPNNLGASGGRPSAVTDQFGQTVGEAVGGGILGSLVGGLTSAVGRGVIAGASGDQAGETQTYSRPSNAYTAPSTYGQSSYGRTPESGDNGGRNTYSQQQTSGRGGRRTDGDDNDSINQRSNYGHQQEQTNYGRQDHDQDQSGRHTYGRRNDNAGGFESSSYGRQNVDNERSSYGRRNDGNNESSSYARRGEDDERPSYNRRNDNENERSSYGRRGDDDDERPNYSRPNDDNNERSSYGRQEQEQSEYSSGGYEQRSSSGRNARSNEYSSQNRYEQASAHGRSGGDQYGNQQQSYGSSGFGRNDREDEYSSGAGYRSDRRGHHEQSEEMPGGFGDAEENNEGRRGGYGRRNEDENEEGQGEYGSGRQYGRQYGY